MAVLRADAEAIELACARPTTRGVSCFAANWSRELKIAMDAARLKPVDVVSGADRMRRAEPRDPAVANVADELNKLAPHLPRSFPRGVALGSSIDSMIETTGSPRAAPPSLATNFDVQPSGTEAFSATNEQPNAVADNKLAPKPHVVRRKEARPQQQCRADRCLREWTTGLCAAIRLEPERALGQQLGDRRPAHPPRAFARFRLAILTAHDALPDPPPPHCLTN
jgi:hypothetical protein